VSGSLQPAPASTRLSAAEATVIGVVAGFASGALGIGGGLVMVPLLTLWIGAPIKRAIGTSLLGVLAISMVAVGTELVVAPANVRFVSAGLLAVGAACGSWIGTRVIARTPPPLLARLMAALLLVAALKMSGLVRLADAGATREDLFPALAVSAAAHVVGGVAAGVVSALFGVGGGILAVPVLAVLHPGWEFQACRATSLAMIIPTSLAGAVLHQRLKNVDGRLAAGLLPGALLGVVGGVILANRVPGRPLEIAFAILLCLAAARLAARGAK
jgi:hypothetical protein